VNQHCLSSRLDFENGLVEELVRAFHVPWECDLNVFDGLAFKRIANLRRSAMYLWTFRHGNNSSLAQEIINVCMGGMRPEFGIM
jgi:hypothetical protein